MTRRNRPGGELSHRRKGSLPASAALPGDAPRGLESFGARVVEHRATQVGCDESPARIEALAQVLGDKSRTARDLEDVAAGIGGQAARKLRGMPPNQAGPRKWS
jgi:hypothetical protein